MLQRVVVDPARIHPPTIQLTAEQQHYLVRVLRLTVGDRFIALDGQGCSWIAQLDATPETYQATILEPILTHTELPIEVVLVLALPKGNAFDEVVRQATELGVSRILPVISDRTLLNPSGHKLDRWRRIVQEAAEQSERQVVPTLLDPISFTDHLAMVKTLPAPGQCCYLCTPRLNAPHLLAQLDSRTSIHAQNTGSVASVVSSPTPKASIYLAIGPEGGWTDGEVDRAIEAGYQVVSLGDRILRTVTAPIVALSLIAAVVESGLLPSKP